MRITWIQHVGFEGLGTIVGWSATRGHQLDRLAFYEVSGDEKQNTAPHQDHLARVLAQSDALIIMGGPMSVHDAGRPGYEWLQSEKNWVKDYLAQKNRPVLGICLGAQILGEILGARVVAGEHKEIGWWPARFPSAPHSGMEWPREKTLFHWHGEQIQFAGPDTPEDSRRESMAPRKLAATDTCPWQGFAAPNHLAAGLSETEDHRNETIWGWQCHLEMDRDAIEKLSENAAHELVDAPFIQTREAMLAGFRDHGDTNRDLLYRFLDVWENCAG